MEITGAHITVRDGRMGTDLALDHPILCEFDSDVIYVENDLIDLPDGTKGKVIGAEVAISPPLISQTVYVVEDWA